MQEIKELLALFEGYYAGNQHAQRHKNGNEADDAADGNHTAQNGGRLRGEEDHHGKAQHNQRAIDDRQGLEVHLHRLAEGGLERTVLLESADPFIDQDHAAQEQHLAGGKQEERADIQLPVAADSGERENQAEYNALFTTDKPIVFAFHGYPSLIHEFTYKRDNKNLHVRGYMEEGTITTPFDMTKISELCGFCSSAYFTKLFHQNIGMTPKEYRKLQLHTEI